ncbi:hypothetical protein LWI29_003336 [Acer saccharum]|uniref:Uncharacterized protein n=1 Tax=Acer saccharum TaxID=4024 RepID=A0AA39S2D9_ACESA|nr:hypothetical protein LWI29_003336 [Acer saccharum]
METSWKASCKVMGICQHHGKLHVKSWATLWKVEIIMSTSWKVEATWRAKVIWDGKATWRRKVMGHIIECIISTSGEIRPAYWRPKCFLEKGKYGNVGNSGGFGAASKNNNVNKSVELDKIAVAKNSTGKDVVGNSNRPRLGVYQGNRKIGGSRFEILSEDLEENVGSNKNKPRTPKHSKPDSNKILSDISNKGKVSSGQSNSHPKKFLEVSMEDELEDSEVLQALHQDMLNSEVTVEVTGESSLNAVGDSILEDSVEQVDVPSAMNFDEVASKLKEAMEVAME